MIPASFPRVNVRKILILLAALFLFVLAIQLLKSGAKVLVPFIRDGLAVRNPWNALGFGWLFAYLVLSGSPVAATTLTFFDAGALSQLGAFAMIAGSRFGASFIVLGLGFIYTLRGHDRKNSLAMGLLSLLVTFSTYLPALWVGYWMLQLGWLDRLQPHASHSLASAMDAIFTPVLTAVSSGLQLVLPPSGTQIALFALGFGVLWYSLNLIDHALPDMRLKESAFGGMARLLYRPWVTFLLGAGITSLTMSVSVSLSLLVPLSARGYIRRENVIPYIMGANITTFIDTLVAALLIGRPGAFTVVLAEMVSVAIISVIILLFMYRAYEQFVLQSVTFIGHSPRNLGVFLLAIVAVPIGLMFIR